MKYLGTVTPGPKMKATRRVPGQIRHRQGVARIMCLTISIRTIVHETVHACLELC
ncbi:hypothetical protein BDV29DRAFT_170273 [Aspergillus leporis]|uniref:Uncharacterized protein n=1 Tax=Aspergillus leporis TaxID=41062 RepID=A0A5N5X6D0_9EURO|nr:hypothetical protein BDV29DRAFT_170273 [Aspergillus leporis]